MERKNSLVKFYHWKDEAIVVGVLMAFAFFINRGIEIRGLSGEDLHLWLSYSGQPFWKFIFPVGRPPFRFLYYLLAYIELAAVGGHMAWFVPCNIIINGWIAYTVFRFGRCVSKNGMLGFLCGFLYLLSSDSCYQISQVCGLGESVALWMAIGILYCLFQYVNQEEHEQPYFVAANALYFAVCFVHERYVALVLALAAAFLLKMKKRPWNGAIPLAVFGLIQTIWRLAAGSMYFAGLGGGGAFLPLPRLGWLDSPRWVGGLVLLANLAMLGILLAFLVKLIRDKAQRKRALCNILLFALFFGACTAGGASGQEPFWIYAPATAAWVFVVYMCGVIGSHGGKALPNYHSMLACILAMAAYTLFMCPVEGHYRGTYSQHAFWHEQQRANSLAGQTYEKYGDALFGKRIYILDNSYGTDEAHIKAFVKAFRGRKKADSIPVFFVDSIRDFGQVTDNMLILREEPQAFAYQDITGFVRQMKCEAVYGYYEDTWMEEHAGIRVMAGETGKIRLQLLYPGVMTGQEVSLIYQDRVLAQEVEIKNSITYVDLQAEPYDIVELEFENNFFMRGGYEKRGEGRLSMMVRVTAD